MYTVSHVKVVVCVPVGLHQSVLRYTETNKWFLVNVLCTNIFQIGCKIRLLSVI